MKLSINLSSIYESNNVVWIIQLYKSIENFNQSIFQISLYMYIIFIK